MKGHAKIELTNVKTGEVQVIEEDNIVTNLLRDLYQTKCLQLRDTFAHTIDMTLTNYDSENSNRPHTPFTEFGGLIIFKEQLEADPDKYYPEEQATMVGHASDDTYAGTDLTRGSFNANLSSYDAYDGTVTLVWDFNMEQGNGTIGTVCLCNHVDGKIGYGSQYSGENTNNAKAPFYHHSGRKVYSSQSNAGVSHRYYLPTNAEHEYLGSDCPARAVYLDYQNNKIVFMHMGLVGSEYVFFTADIDGTTVNPIFYKQYDSSTYHDSAFGRSYLMVRNTVPVYVNRVVKSARSASNAPTNSRYYCPYMQHIKTMAGLDYQGNFWYSSDVVITDGYGEESSSSSSSNYPKTDYAWCWRNNTEMTFNKLNLSTMEVTEYRVTNTTGRDICRNGGYANNHCLISDLCVVNNYMFIRDMGRLIAINLDNNSEVHTVVWENGNLVNLSYSSFESSPNVYCNHSSSGSDSYLYNWGWAVNVLGNSLIFNTGGGYQAGADGNMCIVSTSDFVARRLSSIRKPAMDIDCSSGDRNRGAELAIPVDRNLAMYSYVSLNNSWTASSKYLYSNITGLFHAYNPMGLITINSLAEPVAKTADMTMRITYTLTT